MVPGKGMSEPIGRDEFEARIERADARIRDVERTSNENTGHVERFRDRVERVEADRKADSQLLRELEITARTNANTIRVLSWLVVGVPALLVLLGYALKAIGK